MKKLGDLLGIFLVLVLSLLFILLISFRFVEDINDKQEPINDIIKAEKVGNYSSFSEIIRWENEEVLCYIYDGNRKGGIECTFKEEMRVQNEALGNPYGDLTHQEVMLCEDIASSFGTYMEAVIEARANNLVCFWEY